MKTIAKQIFWLLLTFVALYLELSQSDHLKLPNLSAPHSKIAYKPQRLAREAQTLYLTFPHQQKKCFITLTPGRTGTKPGPVLKNENCNVIHTIVRVTSTLVLYL